MPDDYTGVIHASEIIEVYANDFANDPDKGMYTHPRGEIRFQLGGGANPPVFVGGTVRVKLVNDYDFLLDLFMDIQVKSVDWPDGKPRVCYGSAHIHPTKAYYYPSDEISRWVVNSWSNLPSVNGVEPPKHYSLNTKLRSGKKSSAKPKTAAKKTPAKRTPAKKGSSNTKRKTR